MIDLYCERLGPGLWAEPLNALSNVAFFVAAFAIWRVGRGRGGSGLWLFVTLCAAIGVGSVLFHTFATTWAQVLDVVPIMLFQLVFLWLYPTCVLRMRTSRVVGLLALLAGAALYARQFPDVLNGSLTYVPGGLILWFLGFEHYRRHLVDEAVLLIAAGVFVVALAFRSIDASVCGIWPVGTHFLWHVLDGIVLYLVARAYFMNLPVTGKTA